MHRIQRKLPKLWNLINNTISKVKHKGSIITSITVDSLKQYRPKDIANSFGKFYSELGGNLAKRIVPGTITSSSYLDIIPRNLNSIVLRQTTPLQIDNLIRQLPNKSNHGHDQISNLMFKSLCSSIIFPLCHIFNHSILEGNSLMDGIQIPTVTCTKFLGVHVDHEQSWTIHVNKIIEKLRNNKRLLSLGSQLLNNQCLRNISSIYHRHIEHFFTFLAGNTVFSLLSESPR